MVKMIELFLFGLALLGFWWIKMFSDSRLANSWRRLSKLLEFSKNSSSLMQPACGLMFIFVAGLAFSVDVLGNDTLRIIFGALIMLCLAVMVLGVFPWRLPPWMYPEGQLEKRQRRRAEQLAAEHHHATELSATEQIPDESAVAKTNDEAS